MLRYTSQVSGYQPETLRRTKLHRAPKQIRSIYTYNTPQTDAFWNASTITIRPIVYAGRCKVTSIYRQTVSSYAQHKLTSASTRSSVVLASGCS